MTTKEFHLGDILSITTERLVSPRRIGGVYDILNWMTGENLMTHQLPRASRECGGPLLAQHPDLAAVPVPDQFGDGSGESARLAVETWLAEQVAVYGETREVTPLHPDDHTHIDPLTEIAIVAPHMQVIPVILPGEAGSAIGKLAELRRYLRSTRNDPPF
jgi:hypothetical protein